LIVWNHGWQSESTDGPKGGVAMVAVVTSPQLLDEVWCSAVVVVAWCSGVVVVMCNKCIVVALAVVVVVV